jgi:hypothetical protein
MPQSDYKRFLNFLSTHGCSVDFREFRSGKASRERPMDPPFQIGSQTKTDSANNETMGRTA